jgi:hypothetical protein
MDCGWYPSQRECRHSTEDKPPGSLAAASTGARAASQQRMSPKEASQQPQTGAQAASQQQEVPVALDYGLV